MSCSGFSTTASTLTIGLLLSLSAVAQTPDRRSDGRRARDVPAPFGPGGGRSELELVDRFDADGNSWLNAAERKAAREFAAQAMAEGRVGRRGGLRFRGESLEPAEPGPKVTPSEVKTFPNASLYDLNTLRTFFFEFDGPDWEKELAEFYNTDVEVPARLKVDGKEYLNVGVRFRGASSFFTVPEGRKRSLNVSIDMADKEQRLGGYRTLELLNSHTDPSFLRTVLSSHIARHYIAAPKANFVRVVINGESWGVYVNSQQFNRDFIQDNFATTRGRRWKTPGNPRGRAGLEYRGEDPAEYKRQYEIKTKDDPESWNAFIELCRVLNQTPTERLQAALEPILDIDDTLKFLALQNVFINNDGYWIRSSDYNLYQDPQGRFHLIPHDANETFRAPGGPGWGGGAGVTGVELDPLTGADDPAKPLLSRLLAVPALRTRYLEYVRDMADTWLDWNRLGPFAEQLHRLIADEVKADTRKLSSFDAFEKSLTGDADEPGFRGSRRGMSLKTFADQRRKYLLDYTGH